MVIGGFESIDNEGKKEIKKGALTIDRMSSNVVAIMNALSQNETIFKLLYFHDLRPMNHELENPQTEIDKKAKEVFIDGLIKNLKSEHNRISPLPFNPEATTEEKVFIRVYYNQGDITGGQLVNNSQINIDIICAKNLWLIEDNIRQLGLIRPYAIMSRVIEEVGTRNDFNEIKVGNCTGFQHLTVNAQFECIRLFYDTFELN